MTKEYKPIKIEHLIIERAFWIFTQLSILGLVSFLLSSNYGILVGVSIPTIIYFLNNFLVLRIYNLKRSINMLKFIDVLADQVTKASKEIDDRESKDSK